MGKVNGNAGNRLVHYNYRLIARHEQGANGPFEVLVWSGGSEELGREYLRESQPSFGVSFVLQRVPGEAWESIGAKDFDAFIDELKASGVRSGPPSECMRRAREIVANPNIRGKMGVNR